MTSGPTPSPENPNPEHLDPLDRVRALQENDPDTFRAIADLLWSLLTDTEQQAFIGQAVDAFGSERQGSQDDFINARLVEYAGRFRRLYISERQHGQSRDSQDPSASGVDVSDQPPEA